MANRRPDVAKQLAGMTNRQLEDDLRRSVASAGERRRAAREEQRAASTALAEVVRRAAGEGVPPTEIAQLAGISRQAVYDFLRE